MRLTEYQWSRNPRGLHNEGAYKPLRYEYYTPMQLGWLKLVCGGGEFIPDCPRLLASGITPVIRVYRAVPGAEPVDEGVRQLWERYRAAGALWFEFYNEPNLPDPEWPGEQRERVDYRNIDEVIRPLCENWLHFAEIIIGLNAYPGFPALAETDTAVLWLDALLGYLRDNHRERFRSIAQRGLWASVHPYTLNHFYQEMPGQPSVPRPPELQNGDEGGWRFEYPFDPIAQAVHPGRDVFPTPAAPNGDPNGLTAMGYAFNQRLKQWFDIDPLPALGTEGGIYPLPIHESHQPDPHYPPYTRTSHGEATVGMFNWIATTGPTWLFGVCLWKEDEYFSNQLPAVGRMIQTPQLAYGAYPPGVNLAGRGPGPVHGEPTHHAVVLGPGLDTRWFFDTARAYWNQFRPIVTTRWDFIEHIPYSQSLAVTVITPPDSAHLLTDQIQRRWPNVLFDLVLANGDLQHVSDLLAARVRSNRRLG